MLVLALLLAAALTLWAHLSLRGACGGELCFPLDDAYIHLAIADHAGRGTWGLVLGEPGSSTSSPLWTALLVPLSPLGEAGPLLLAAASAALLLGVAARSLPEQTRAPGLLALVLLVPLPVMLLLGMEHLLHAALALALVQHREHRRAWVLAALLPLVRLEGLFIVAAVLPWVSRGQALRLGLAAVLPSAAYAAWSISAGWFLLPSAVLLKSALGSASPLSNLRSAPGLVALLLLLVPAALATGRGRPWAAVALACGLLQLTLARFGWLARYEAWLVALAVVALCHLARRPWHLLPLLLLLPRAWQATVDLPDRAGTTWRQHVHLGRFLATLPPDTPVATTEAGAPTWLSEVRLVDLAGLGHVEIARALRDGRSIHPLLQADPPRLAAVFGWYDGPPHGPGLPPDWVLLGRWTDPAIPESAWLGFWSPGPDPALDQALEAFAAALPPGVEWRPAR